MYDPLALEFQNPLFLRIFCMAYSAINPYYRSKIDRLILFDNYLNYRNEAVSILAEEDPKRNITLIYLNKLASYSAFYCDCGLVSRTKARTMAHHCCPGRTWPKHLLHALLTENLLMDAYGREKGQFVDMVMFEFENMGDFLKARAVRDSKMSDEACIDFLLMVYKRFNRNSNETVNPTKFYNMVTALISIWNRPLSLLQSTAFTDGPFKHCLINSIIYRGSHHADIENWMTESFDRMDFHTLFDYYPYLTSKAMERVHTLIKAMPMAVRDKYVAVKVNEEYNQQRDEIAKRLLHLPVFNDKMAQSLAIILCWMQSSSYPYLRAYVTRQLYHMFCKRTQLILPLIEIFKDVDDPYILQGLYAAIYGFTLLCLDSGLVDSIAETVFNAHYADRTNVPLDLLVRTWTLKILERAHSLNPNSQYWLHSCPPYVDTPNPFTWKESGIDENYFGESDGSHRIYESLFGFEDFNRYIIGTNSRHVSSVLYDEDGNGISLGDILLMIAPVIKNQLGWNEELAEYDKGKYSPDRHINKVERIGKKYQWIAYYKVMALLADHCQVRASDDYLTSYKGYREPPYPWYVDCHSYFDPTLESSDVLVDSLGLNFNSLPEMPIGDETPIEWVTNNSILPSLSFVATDNDGMEWIMLSSYDGNEKELDDLEKQDLFIFANACFVHDEDAEIFAEWAESKNFYGRWMPEKRSSGCEFLWNEFPWSDAYRYMDYQRENWLRIADCPCDIMLTYESQLQEDNKGLLQETYSTTVLMPCVEMMEELGLYTAERGIIRRKEDNCIVGINRSPYIDQYQGFFIRRDLLNQYVEAKKYTMFYYTLGEKMYRVSTSPIMRELSACHRYETIGEIFCVQSLHVEYPNLQSKK